MAIHVHAKHARTLKKSDGAATVFADTQPSVGCPDTVGTRRDFACLLFDIFLWECSLLVRCSGGFETTAQISTLEPIN